MRGEGRQLLLQHRRRFKCRQEITGECTFDEESWLHTIKNKPPLDCCDDQKLYHEGGTRTTVILIGCMNCEYREQISE